MADGTYEVVVTGAGAGPAGELRLAAELARRRGLPAARVAEELGAGRFLVATRLAHAAAQQLASELEGLGARVSVRAAGEGPLEQSEGDGSLGHAPGGAATSGAARQASPASRTVQCPRHGLPYDPLIATGCRRCKMEEEQTARGARAAGVLADPTRRLFLGLALALLVGFVPAALYARGPGLRAVNALRAEQARLSDVAASHETTVAYFRLDEEVAVAFRRTALATLGFWLGLSACAGAVFARLTRPRG